MAALKNTVWRAKGPSSFLDGGEKDGTSPRGNPFPRRESCWILRTRLALAPSIGIGSPGMERTMPSRVLEVETLRSQNAASIAVRRLAISPTRLAGRRECCRGAGGENGEERFLICD